MSSLGIVVAIYAGWSPDRHRHSYYEFTAVIHEHILARRLCSSQHTLYKIEVPYTG